MVGSLGNQTGEHHIRQVVVTHNVSVVVVGDAATVWVRSSLSGDVLAHVGAVVTQHTDCYRSDIPSVVGIVKPCLHLVGGGGRHFIEAIYLGDDTLAGAVFLQLVGIFGPSVVVRGDDDVLGTIVVAAQPFLHTGFIVDDGQLVVVQQLSSEDGIPIGGT